MADPQHSPESELFMRMLSNRKEVLAALIEDLDTCRKNAEVFSQLEELFRKPDAVIDTQKVLQRYATSIRHVNEMNGRLVVLLMAYASSDTFSSDTSSLLVRMGRGVEALRAFFKQKMGGSDL